ncbi:hypothetical protein CYY_009421 [Polysphondylium violaceum]|uniref:EGF-like domain-containing protein n=1 Tax=Polysphondylium violaceum TaxID=133409 RepID=A0A8J4PLV0_9MYCE|nr:hypothetical protein CYY_009421 [Polysphondylium violaceum]
MALLIVDVNGFSYTDLTVSDYNDMYAQESLIGRGWECESKRDYLFNDPTGILNVDVDSPAFLYIRKMVSNTTTQALYTLVVLLKPATTTFVLNVHTNTTIVKLDVAVICELPPTPDLQFFSGDEVKFFPGTMVAQPYFLFKVKNFNKPLAPRLQVINIEGNYDAVPVGLTKNVYIVTLVVKSKDSMFGNSNFNISNGYNGYYIHQTRSFLPNYNNIILQNSIETFALNGQLFYPEVCIMNESHLDSNTPMVKFFEINNTGYLETAPLVLGNYSTGVYFRKYSVRSYGQGIFTSYTYNPNSVVNISTIGYYEDPGQKPFSLSVLSTLENQNVINVKYVTNVTLKSDLINVNGKVMVIPYPFSYSAGNSLSYEKNHAFYFEPIFYTRGSLYDGVVNPSFVLTGNLIDTEPPKIISIASLHLPNQPYVVLRMEISDYSGFNTINFGDYKDIISGTFNHGVYEFLCRQSNAMLQLYGGQVRIEDVMKNYLDFSVFNTYVNVGLEKYPFKFLNLLNIKSIKFEKNDIDTSDKSVDNHMFLYPHIVDTNVYPGFIVPSFGDILSEAVNTFTGVWNGECGCYVIPFTVPMNYPTGRFEYFMAFSGDMRNIYSVNYLVDMFGSDAALRVYSNTTDLIGPVIQDVAPQTSAVVVPDGVDTIIKWNFAIFDYFNGFKSGLITVVSSLDLVKYNFTITADDRISGTIYEGIYSINITVNGRCKSQSFYIQYAFMEDRAGKYSEYRESGPFPSSQEKQHINPFMMIGNITEVSKIDVDCQNSLLDTIPPLLGGFKFTPEFIDTANSTRQVLFEFETKDDNGILLAALPVVYLQEQRTNIVYKTATLVSYISDIAKYECLFDIPFLFGFNSSIKVSVFGIVDNQSNFNGYSMIQLQNAGFKNTINTESKLAFNLTILSTKEVYKSGGEIIIVGRNFSPLSVLIITYTNQTIRTIADPLFSSKTVVMFDMGKGEILGPNITITINDKIQYSNSFTVQVINKTIASPVFPPDSSSSDEPPVTNKPQICISDCGGLGHGVCTPAGCVCKSPWVGVSCTSQVIIIDPVINSTTPSTNITVPTKDKTTAIYYAIISVVALNELDQNGQLVQKHEFPSWIVSNNTISKYSQYTNSSYLYTSSINNNNTTTNVNVSIDYFNQDQPVNITFANQIITMNPYSLKYSVNISEYSFSSSLNTLQLVLLASIETDSNEECSSKQFGETVESNSEYIKMQVNDHSLYGRFIKRGVVDGRVKSVSNILLDNQFNSVSTQSEQQTYIGINIPFYSKSVQLDPDFSVLVDNKPASDTDDAICGKGKTKLTHAQIAGIVIGAAAFTGIVVVGVSYALYKSRQQKNFRNSLSLKMKEASSENK